jgi:hypothetical protein
MLCYAVTRLPLKSGSPLGECATLLAFQNPCRGYVDGSELARASGTVLQGAGLGYSEETLYIQAWKTCIIR